MPVTEQVGLAELRTKDRPSDLGFQAHTFPITKISNSQSAATATTLYCLQIKVPSPITVTQAAMVVRVAASGTTSPSVFYALFNAAGTRLGVTADQGTAWKTAGLVAATLTADSTGSLTLPAGYVWGAWLLAVAGTTAASIGTRTSSGAVANAGLLDVNGLQLSGAVMRSFKVASVSTMPTSIASYLTAGGLSFTSGQFMGLI